MRKTILGLLLSGACSCSSAPTASGSPDASSADQADAAPLPSPRQLELFDPEVVQEIELEIAQTDLDAMQAALPMRILVPATFQWKDVALAQVGVRYKGNSSSSPNQPYKRSFLVDFDAFVPGQRFLGLRSVALDNGIQFGSVFSERLITDILSTEGVPSSRANYARLRLNGQYLGLYVNVERIDKSFLKRNFVSDEGTLYKCDEGGPGADLAYRGADPATYAMAFEAKTNELRADRTELVAFMKMLDSTPDADIAAALADSFEVDGFLRQTAILMLAGAFDQYTGFQAHNYYLYRDPATARFSYIPWDLDVGFADDAFGRIAVIDGWNAGYPLPVVPRPLLERMLENADLLASYRAHAAIMLEKHFRPEVLGARLDVLYEQARPHLADDPFAAVRVTNPEDTSYDGIVASMKAFMRRRYERAAAELANPKMTPPLIDVPSDMPTPSATSSAQDPTGLRVLSSSGSRVELAWTDNASDEVASIVQKCGGTDCTSFMNAIGMPGANVTTATDTGVTPGAAYRYRVYAVRPGPAGGPVGTGPSNVVTAVVTP